MSPVELGAAAYNAYCEQRNWRSFKGDPLPQFTEQSPDLQIAWIKAAFAARSAGYAPQWEYRSESMPGNLHALCVYLNSLKEPRDVVCMDSHGSNTTVVWRVLRAAPPSRAGR